MKKLTICSAGFLALEIWVYFYWLEKANMVICVQHLCAKFIREWKPTLVQKTKICTNLVLLNMSTVREVALRNEVIREIRGMRELKKPCRKILSFEWWRNWGSCKGSHLAKITHFHHWQSVHWLLVEHTTQNYRCSFWELKLLFPVPMTFASGQKQWSQKKYQLAIPVFCPEPHIRAAKVLQGSTSRSRLSPVSCQVSSWDPPFLVPTPHASCASCGFGFTLIDIRKTQRESFFLREAILQGFGGW